MMKGDEMSVLEGFGDLKPKDVLVFNANGTILVAMKEKVELMQLQVSPTGCLTARKIDMTELDQVPQRRVRSREERLAMTDQGAQMLGGG